jgi:hypothetical protein
VGELTLPESSIVYEDTQILIYSKARLEESRMSDSEALLQSRSHLTTKPKTRFYNRSGGAIAFWSFEKCDADITASIDILAGH